MFAQRSSGHSRVVAFIVVLAMILMYTFSFAGLAFAGAPGSPNYWTTDDQDDYQQLNAYIDKEDVYVRFQDYVASTTTPSTLYIKIESPSGTPLGNGTLIITAPSGVFNLWANVAKVAPENGIGYNDTDNNGGQYKLFVSTDSNFPGGGGGSKTFSVVETPPPTTGTLTVYKNVMDNQVDIADNTVFEFYLDGNTGTTYDFSELSPGSIELNTGTYVVYEAAKAGYTTAITTYSAIVTTEGAMVTFTNEKNDTPPPPTGRLTVNKNVVDNQVDIADNTVFEFYLDGNTGTTYDFSELSPGSIELNTGTYVVYEVAKAGYTTETTTHEAIVTTEGAMVTFTNEKNDTPPPPTGRLTVNKNVVDNQVDIADNTVFQYYLDGQSNTTYNFSELSPGSIELPTGTYVVYEAAKAGYTTETTTHEAIVTTEGAMVTFINEKNDTPPTTGTITVYKDVRTSTGGAVVDTTSDFAFSITDAVEDISSNFAFRIMDLDDFTTTFAITDGEHMTYTLPFGTYTVTETGYGDYTPQTTQTALTISSTTPTAMFTFVNWQPGDTPPPPTGRLTVNKNVVDNQVDIADNTVFQYYLDGQSNTPYNFSELSPGSIELPTGNYVVHEAAKTGYTTAITTYAAFVTTSGTAVTFTNEKNDPPVEGFDIEVEKTVNDTTAYPNQTVTFTVTVTNNGPDAAYEISVYDLIPQGLEVDSILASGGTTFNEGVWTIGTLLSGESETLTIEAVVTAAVGTVITNTAGWDGKDNDSSNNEDSASTTVVRRPSNDDDDEEDIPEDPIPEGPTEEPPVVIPEIDPPLADVPQTGDSTNTALLAVLMIGSLGGLAALTRKKKLEKSDNN